MALRRHDVIVARDLGAEVGDSLTMEYYVWRTEGRIEIVREYGDVGPLLCNPRQLNQVFMNLLLNAIQAIEGTGTITLRVLGMGEEVMASVADDGVGMSPEVASKVFDPFFTTRAVGEGMGLGLSVSHGIIDRMGGQIELRTVPGEGSEFRVILPLRVR